MCHWNVENSQGVFWDEGCFSSRLLNKCCVSSELTANDLLPNPNLIDVSSPDIVFINLCLLCQANALGAEEHR